MKNNIVSIDAVISRIEKNGYIDCTELGGYMEDYEYDNIIYYLKKYKDLQNRIDKAIEYIKHYETIRGYYEYVENGYDEYNYEEDLKEELLDILKESGE